MLIFKLSVEQARANRWPQNSHRACILYKDYRYIKISEMGVPICISNTISLQSVEILLSSPVISPELCRFP
jgi:hypothetical protein